MNIYRSSKPMPYVYVCIHKQTKQFYIGYREKNIKLCRTSDVDLPLYRTSSVDVNPIFGEFDWYIIAEFFDGNDAYDFEQELIKENWCNPLLINKQFHTVEKTRFKHMHHSEEAKLKIGSANQGKKRTDEYKQHMSNIKRGKKLPPRSEEHKQNISLGKLGRKRLPPTEIARANMRQGQLHRTDYKPFTDEHRKKLSDAKRGKKRPPRSEEHKKKLREANEKRRNKKMGATD